MRVVSFGVIINWIDLLLGRFVFMVIRDRVFGGFLGFLELGFCREESRRC